MRETALAAYVHQDVPFEKLVEELAPERSLAHAPLFQVMLVLQNAPTESLEVRDLRLRPVDVLTTTAKFDLTVSLGEHAGELAGFLEYSTSLFDGTTVDRLGGQHERADVTTFRLHDLGDDVHVATMPSLVDLDDDFHRTDEVIAVGARLFADRVLELTLQRVSEAGERFRVFR